MGKDRNKVFLKNPKVGNCHIFGFLFPLCSRFIAHLASCSCSHVVPILAPLWGSCSFFVPSLFPFLPHFEVLVPTFFRFCSHFVSFLPHCGVLVPILFFWVFCSYFVTICSRFVPILADFEVLVPSVHRDLEGRLWWTYTLDIRFKHDRRLPHQKDEK